MSKDTASHGNPFEARQRDLSGSVIVAQGQSGTGKTRLLTESWIRAGMLFGGACFALAPVQDVEANVTSYRLGYQRALDKARRDKAPRTAEHAIKCLDFLRTQVVVFRDPVECLDAIEQYAEVTADGRPQFSLLFDESAVARRESPILETLGPLARNLRGIVYLTGHRSMALPPAMRAVRRATVVWKSSDGTGDEELERAIASIPGFKYSPVMGSVPKEDRFYRGVKYTANGPEFFEFNPHITGFPDWMLLPALPTAIEPRTLT